jgi:BNR/Asp-box repeat
VRLRRPLPLFLVLVIAGCGGSDPEPPAPSPEPTVAAVETPSGDAELSTTPPPAPDDGSSPAVNSIAVDPGDGTIIVGTGPALFVVPPGANEGERTLGQLTTPQGPATVSGNLVVRFTGANEILASGHPQQGNVGENLPLIRSSDHGKTWETVPGTAEGDYHELEVFGDRIFAVNVESPDIQVSSDGGKTWETRTPPNLPIDIVVDPGNPERWAVSTEQGTFISSDNGGSWRPRDTAMGARLAWPEADALYSLDRNGKLRVSSDGGESWKDRGDVGGLPSEFTASGRKDELFVAVVGGKIRKSADGGKSWSTAATLR